MSATFPERRFMGSILRQAPAPDSCTPADLNEAWRQTLRVRMVRRRSSAAAFDKLRYGAVTRRFSVTHLRKLMLEELERRNYAASTTRAYLRAVVELCALLQPCSRPTRAGSHPPVPGVSVPRKKAPAQHHDPASRRDPFLLHPDAKANVERGSDPLPTPTAGF
jgi:hypothetical protein